MIIQDLTPFSLGVILAGGKGLRMGEEKALLVLEGKTLLQRVHEALSQVFPEVIVVAHSVEPFAHLPYRCVADRSPGLGPLSGIETALREAGGKAIFVVACDMPFLNPEVIRHMIDLQNGYDLVIPDLSDGLHPLHALYTPGCLPAIQAKIEAGDLTLHTLSRQVRTYRVREEFFHKFDPQLRSVMNLNTPEEMERARALLEVDPDID